MTDTRTPEEWLSDQFEYVFCEECGGDARHHTVCSVLGNYFARCDYPRLDDGRQHPIIAAYRQHLFKCDATSEDLATVNFCPSCQGSIDQMPVSRTEK